MNNETAEQMVLRVITDLTVGMDKPTSIEETPIETLFPTSLDKVTFAMALGDELNLDIPDGDIANLTLISDVIIFIQDKLKELVK